MSVEKTVREWAEARAGYHDTARLDAKYAMECGLPTLAALYELVDKLNSKHYYMTFGEISAEVRKLIRIATGEAQRRSEVAGKLLEFPGLASVPAPPILEELLAQGEHSIASR